MFRPRMDMAALAASARPQRFELRRFREGLRRVDVLDPHALIPVGTRIVCTAGHAITTTVDSIHRGQRVAPPTFGTFEPFQGLRGPSKDVARGIPGQRCGPCLCGRPWSGWGRIHTEHGWRPHGDQPPSRTD